MAVPSALIGWPLLPRPDQNGRLAYPGLAESVRQSIEVILRTRPGEQLMRPRFGAGLQEFLNESNTLTTRRHIRERVEEALDQWEGRILLDRVEVWEEKDAPSHLRIEIGYRLRRTGEPQQVSLTMELEG